MTGTSTRLIRVDDAAGLAAVRSSSRARLQAFEPRRDDSFYTERGQLTIIRERLAQHADGRLVPMAIVDHADTVVGEITVSSIVRGAFQSASVGYWV